MASKMHELAAGVDVDDPHFEAKGAFSSLAAYNRSKLCQARRPSAPRTSTSRAGMLLAGGHQRGRQACGAARRPLKHKESGHPARHVRCRCCSRRSCGGGCRRAAAWSRPRCTRARS